MTPKYHLTNKAKYRFKIISKDLYNCIVDKIGPSDTLDELFRTIKLRAYEGDSREVYKNIQQLRGFLMAKREDLPDPDPYFNKVEKRAERLYRWFWEAVEDSRDY